MKKASFVLAAFYAAKAFTTKMNFVNAVAKKLNIKKADALALADGIEASTEDAIEPATFKALFVEAATNAVKESLLNRIVTPTHKAEVAEVVAIVETPEEKAKRLARNKASRKSHAKAKTAKKVAEVPAL